MNLCFFCLRFSLVLFLRVSFSLSLFLAFLASCFRFYALAALFRRLSFNCCFKLSAQKMPGSFFPVFDFLLFYLCMSICLFVRFSVANFRTRSKKKTKKNKGNALHLYLFCLRFSLLLFLRISFYFSLFLAFICFVFPIFCSCCSLSTSLFWLLIQVICSEDA